METTLENARLLLASASPRRRELLALCGVPFAVTPAEADEVTLPTAEATVLENARRKAAEVAARHPSYPVLAADTVVCVDGRILGKPTDAEDAARMLRLLSGRVHQVHTAVCLAAPGQSAPDLRLETTDVRFCALSERHIAAYVASGEPFGKAGAYAIQGACALFVEAVAGSPSCVIGLPMAAVRAMLEQAGFDLPLVAGA